MLHFRIFVSVMRRSSIVYVVYSFIEKRKIFFVCDFACSFFVFTGISSQISAMLGSFLLPVKFRLSLFVWKCYLFCGFMIKKLTECG